MGDESAEACRRLAGAVYAVEDCLSDGFAIETISSSWLASRSVLIDCATLQTCKKDSDCVVATTKCLQGEPNVYVKQVVVQKHHQTTRTITQTDLRMHRLWQGCRPWLPKQAICFAVGVIKRSRYSRGWCQRRHPGRWQQAVQRHCNIGQAIDPSRRMLPA